MVIFVCYGLKYTIKNIGLFLLVLFSVKLTAQEVRFIQNKGQWNSRVLFKADIPGGDLFITAQGLVYNLYDEGALHRVQHDKSIEQVNAHSLFVDFVGAQLAPVAIGQKPYQTVYNYYLGNDKSKWASNVKGFKKVVLQNIYPNIDFEIEGVNGGVKSAFLVRGNASTQTIKLAYRGAQKTSLVNGELVVQHSLGNLKELAPESFVCNQQKQQQVISNYLLQNDTLSYQIINPKGKEFNDTLVIDPSIVFSTFSGSVADNFGYTATYDKDGNAYGGGTVFAIGFPVTVGAYQINFVGGSQFDDGGARDAGILKFSPNGQQLLYATYLGGNSSDQPHSMSCDAQGNLYILGSTQSSNFPTQGAYDGSFNGSYDIFICKLNPSGTSLLASTFYGGSFDDGINSHTTSTKKNQLSYNYGDDYRGDIRLDAAGNVYIASTTQSAGLTLPNASQSTYGGGYSDGLFLKFSSNLNSLLFGTYIGGSDADAAYGLRLNGAKVFVTGGTLSNNLPQQSTNGTFLYHGGCDGFLAQFTQNSGVFALNKILYIGTSSYDQTYFVFTDNLNRVYVTGQSAGTTTKVGNVYHETNGRHFVSVIAEDLNSIVLQTAFGSGSPVPKISLSAFMVDDCDRVYISGWGGSANNSHNNNTSNTTGLITTADAFQRTTDGSDFYLIIFNKDLANVGYATYFGGPNSHEHVDGGTSHFDEAGVVYQSVCAGCGGLSDMPTTPNAYSRTNNGKRPYDPTQGGCNNAVFKFNARPTPFPPVMRDTTLYVTTTDSLNYTFNITDANLDSIFITQLSGTLTTLLAPNAPQVSATQVSPGLLNVKLKWLSDCAFSTDTFKLKLNLRDNACEGIQTSSGTITIVVKPLPTPITQLECLKRSGDKDVILNWNTNWLTQTDAKYIKSIRVFSVDDTTLTQLDEIDKSTGLSTFTHKNLDSIATKNYCYRIATINVCNQINGYSRLSCISAVDTSLSLDFLFAKDTIYKVFAGDTLSTQLEILDMNVANMLDSIFVSYKGTLIQEQGAKITHVNGIKKASVSIWYNPPCDKIGDTLALHIKVQDNRCPFPRRDTGVVYVVVLPPPAASSTALNCIKNLPGTNVAISWKEPAQLNYLKNFGLLKQSKNGTSSLVGTYPAINTNDVIQTINNKLTDTTCFALIAYDYCDLPTDTGDFTCLPWPDDAYPQGVLPHYVTVINNKDIELSWHNDSLPLAEIFRYEPLTSAKTLLASVPTAPTDSVWVDKNVDVQKQRYCYVIEPLNACGLRPKVSSYACSMLLKGTTKPFEHQLNWTTYSYFELGTEMHQLYTRDLTETNFRLATTENDIHVNNYTDVALNKETGIFYYQVTATEHAPNMYISQSNTIELKQAPLLYVPNAYTPNGDALNDSWNIVPVFVKDYHLRLYNRWGQLVFETKDKHQLVNDKDLNGLILQNEVYVYVITYTGFEDTFKQVTGNVTILK